MSLLFKPNLAAVDSICSKAAVTHIRSDFADEPPAKPKSRPRRPRPRRPWTDREREIALELRAFGMSIDDISELLNRSSSTVATFSQNFAGEITRRKNTIKQTLITRFDLNTDHLV